MNDNELYLQKHRVQLGEWKADIAKLQAKVSWAKADVQIALNQEIATLDRKLENYQAKLAELADTSEDAWGTVKKELETAWKAMGSALGEAALRFKTPHMGV